MLVLCDLAAPLFGLRTAVGAPIRLAWNGGGTVGLTDDLTGLCVFNWFIDGAGPAFFALPDIKLSRSMEILPEFDHVAPTGTVLAIGLPLAAEDALKRLRPSTPPVVCIWLLDGWRMFSVRERKCFYEALFLHSNIYHRTLSFN